MTFQPIDNNDAVKEQLKKMGKKLRSSNPSHQSFLRQQLECHQQPAVEPKRSWRWILVPASGLVAVFLVAVVANRPSYPYVMEDSIAIQQETASSTGVAMEASEPLFADTLSMIAPSPDIFPFYPSRQKESAPDIAKHQDENGIALDERRNYKVYMKDLDEKTEVQDLFTLYEGTVTQITDYDRQWSIYGTIPRGDLNDFHERLESLASHDKYFSMTSSGYSRTEELMRARTNEARARIEGDIEYVDVSVLLNKLPGLWSGHYHEIRKVIAGFDSPGLGQVILINVVFAFSVAFIIFSATFWILIPLAYLLWRRRRSRSLLKRFD